MKESYGEVLANHSSLESCGNCSNTLAEALTEGSTGGLLSAEITSSRVSTTWFGWEDKRKSDNNIVPEKPVNNEDKTLAEQVEGRALTKGNIMNTAAAVHTQG